MSPEVVTSQNLGMCYTVSAVEMQKQCVVCVVRRQAARRIRRRCSCRKDLRIVLVEGPEQCPASFFFLNPASGMAKNPVFIADFACNLPGSG